MTHEGAFAEGRRNEEARARLISCERLADAELRFFERRNIGNRRIFSRCRNAAPSEGNSPAQIAIDIGFVDLRISYYLAATAR